jgi:hypothetical protein
VFFVFSYGIGNLYDRWKLLRNNGTAGQLLELIVVQQWEEAFPILLFHVMIYAVEFRKWAKLFTEVVNYNHKWH